MHTTRARRGVVVAIALSTLTTLAHADAVVLGSSAAMDPAHFTCVPILGPWLDIGRLGPLTSALVVDGIMQDLVAVTVVARLFSHTLTSTWHVAPWFPRSGGGFTFTTSF